MPYGLALLALVVACAPDAGSLLVPVVVYGVCLVTMAVVATGVDRLAAVGGAVFLLSDALIALNAFAPWYDLPGTASGSCSPTSSARCCSCSVCSVESARLRSPS